MALKEYIAETLAQLHYKQNVDYEKEAELIMEKVLNPTYTPGLTKTPRNYTKVQSYIEFKEHYGSKVYQLVYDTIENAELPLSRREIADRAGIRVSTVCARVAELQEAGAISVTGTKLDSDSLKRVEVLSVRWNSE